MKDGTDVRYNNMNREQQVQCDEKWMFVKELLQKKLERSRR